MIEVEGLRHAYGTKAVLDGVSFRVGPGEIVGYLGPNGAGKSTTIRILLGLLEPLEGTVRVLGLDPAAEPQRVRSMVGYVPESGALYETLTPVEYLTLVGRLQGLEEAATAARAEELLGAFDLRVVSGKRMTTFSKGMKQKVVIAASLIHAPRVLFLDEPLNGLDANATVTVKEVIRGLAARGTTVFYSSHLMDVVERVSDRVIVIDRGRVVADGDVAALRARSGDATLEALFQRLTSGDAAGGGASRILDAIGGAARGPEAPPASAAPPASPGPA
jgi:ABC-2 type transport system ATP-binding protein